MSEIIIVLGKNWLSKARMDDGPAVVSVDKHKRLSRTKERSF